MRSERAEAVDWVLLKNRNIHQFDYRFSPPEAFVNQADVIQRLRRKDLSPEIWLRTPRLVFRDIARNDDERTLIACLAPPGNLSSYDTPMVVPPQTATALRTALSFYCGLFNCFLADFLIRPFVDKHIKGYVLNRVPWIHLDYINSKDVWSADWLLTRVLELIYTNDDFESFAEDCGYTGEPFRWDEARRFLLRAELDAAYFHLYGIAREDVDYILDTFPIVRRKDEKEHGEYRTKRVIMEIYDALQQAITSGQPYQTRLDPPPAHGWTPPVIREEGGKMNDEVPAPGDPPFQLQMQDARPQPKLFDGVE